MDDSERVKSLIESLELHQAELNAQNDALQSTLQALSHTNAELERSARRYHELYDLAPSPYITLEPDRSITQLNAAAAALLVRPAAQLVGARFDVFVAEDHRPAFRDFLVRALVGGAEIEASLQLVDDAPPREVLLHGAPHHEDGQTRCLLAVVDLTAHKNAERERAALARQTFGAHKTDSLELLAGGVAHDFNNLLTVILSSTERARHVTSDPAHLGQSLDAVTDAALHGANLARQMLLYAGKHRFTKEVVDLAALVRELGPLVIAAATPITTGLDVGDQPIHVVGDPTQLRQIVLNLVANAAEAIGTHAGAIEVSLAHDDMHALLTVRDTGPGIAEEAYQRMFEPFYSTKLARGLGLAVVQGIVRSHGGTTRVSTTPGVGTTFSIALPRTTQTITRLPASLAGPATAKTGTLLLVDDIPDVVDTLADLLQLLGFTAVVAYDGHDAIELVRAEPHKFDAAIVDLSMPRIDGVAWATAVRAIRPDLPIALTSGRDELPPDGERLFKALLSKPYTSADLMHVLATLLGERT